MWFLRHEPAGGMLRVRWLGPGRLAVRGRSTREGSVQQMWREHVRDLG